MTPRLFQQIVFNEFNRRSSWIPINHAMNEPVHNHKRRVLFRERMEDGVNKPVQFTRSKQLPPLARSSSDQNGVPQEKKRRLILSSGPFADQPPRLGPVRSYCRGPSAPAPLLVRLRHPCKLRALFMVSKVFRISLIFCPTILLLAQGSVSASSLNKKSGSCNPLVRTDFHEDSPICPQESLRSIGAALHQNLIATSTRPISQRSLVCHAYSSCDTFA
jgi:hypothetical protein